MPLEWAYSSSAASPSVMPYCLSARVDPCKAIVIASAACSCVPPIARENWTDSRERSKLICRAASEPNPMPRVTRSKSVAIARMSSDDRLSVLPRDLACASAALNPSPKTTLARFWSSWREAAASTERLTNRPREAAAPTAVSWPTPNSRKKEPMACLDWSVRFWNLSISDCIALKRVVTVSSTRSLNTFVDSDEEVIRQQSTSSARYPLVLSRPPVGVRPPPPRLERKGMGWGVRATPIYRTSGEGAVGDEDSSLCHTKLILIASCDSETLGPAPALTARGPTCVSIMTCCAAWLP
jgi:hypothetical protein